MVYAIGQGILPIDENLIKIFWTNYCSGGLFYFFSPFLNRPYKEHLVVGGQIESLWMPGFLACTVSGFIEFIAIAFLLAL
ncbi:hypothetical protein OL548_22430 [Lysinibacillus sp. MHQ-1]|nr:hypothetical protein OL548_22430 [Lysinibacillus sp. MHQ-1]